MGSGGGVINVVISGRSWGCVQLSGFDGLWFFQIFKKISGQVIRSFKITKYVDLSEKLK